MKKSPIEIVRLNPVYKEKIDSDSAKLLRSKLYQLSKESMNNELPATCKKESIKNVHSGLNRKSIPVPPLLNVGSEGLLPLQVCNWLIYSHLLRWNYRCTIASFQSESHMSGNPENTFTVYDILDLLGISRDSIFYTNFLAEYNEMENKGTLYTLLKHCIKHRIVKSSTDAAVQVNSVEKTKSIAEKLKEIDEVFKEKQRKLKESSSALQNNEMKKTIENDEILQIERKIEIENIKKREKIAYQMELENVTLRIKEEYEARLEMLQQKQIDYQNEIQKKRALEQQEINRLKEQLIQELDNIQKYEDATKQEIEQKRNQLDIETKTLLEKKNDLQMKEYELEKQRIQAVALSEEMSDTIQKSVALKVEQKLSELKAWEEKLRSEAEWLQEERHQASKKASEVDDLKPKLYELELSLKSLQEKYSALVKQNTKMSNKLDSVTDYNSIKAELNYTKKELETVKGHLAETRNEALSAAKSNIQYLREQRSPEGRESHHLPLVDTSDQILLQTQCKRLEKEIEELHHLNERVSIRNDHQQQEIEELRRTVQSFEVHLYNSQNKFNRFPVKEDKSSMPQFSNAKQTTVPVSLWEDKTIDSIHSLNHPSILRKHIVSSFSPPTPHTLKRARSFDKEKPLRFITEARKRIDYLQIEAEALEKKYGEYLQSQANLFWAIPTSINTLFPGTDHSSLSQNLREISKIYNPHMPFNGLKNKSVAQHLHLSPALKRSSQTIPSSNYLTIGNIPRTMGGKNFYLAESTNISIQQDSPQDKSETSTFDKNKLILDAQPHKTNSLLSKDTGELVDNDQTNESNKDAYKSIPEAREIIEEKESMHSANSKEFSTHVSKASDINISDDKISSNGRNLEHSSAKSNSLKVFDKDPCIKSNADNHLNDTEAAIKEESSYPNEVENKSSPNLSSAKISNYSEVQDKSSLIDKVEGKVLENTGLFHQNNSSEKHSLKNDYIDHFNSSEKRLNKSSVEENIVSSESHNMNVHTLPSAANNNEKVQETSEKNLSQHSEIGDAFHISLHNEIEKIPVNSKAVLSENDHSVSSKKSDNGNSSSHKTDAPEISEISISAGNAACVSKGSAESDFW